MKIIKDNKCYVQIMDILEMHLTSKGELPEIIKQAIKEYNILDKEPTKLREFICFEGEQSINIFKNTEWIIDYNEYIEKDEEEINTIIKQTQEEKDTIFNEYLNSSYEDKCVWIYSDKAKKCELYDYKIRLLNYILEIKQGLYSIDIPNSNPLKLTKKN